MGRYITPLLLGLCLIPALAAADSDEDIRAILETRKHHIKIIAEGDDAYTYQVWNKPKKLDQGKPDWIITNGTAWGPVSATDVPCIRGSRGYDFTIHNTTINIALYGCPEKGQPKDASGVMEVRINGKIRSQYWLYAR